mgnify:CR=1 FL=1
MSTKINNINEVKELFNNYVKPTIIGNSESCPLKLSPQEATWKANNIINVCKMALTGINESWGGVKVSELSKTTNTGLNDVIECLEIASELLPNVELEFIERLQTDLID